ncbi:ubiquitin carboxyl-terminal hydrolase usp-48-like [Cloeon dipterum]|uniref:ubiquitin carboxyl-terminal hydrolase usp-48-like n=1 Tax=Cloeon dipterum TaxID=197152 RepID=UPI00321FE7A9
MGKTVAKPNSGPCVSHKRAVGFAKLNTRFKNPPPLCEDKEFLKYIEENAYAAGPQMVESRMASTMREYFKDRNERQRKRAETSKPVVNNKEDSHNSLPVEPEISITVKVNAPANTIFKAFQNIPAERPTPATNKINHPGFKNPRYLCYIISSIQLLLSSPKIVNYFVNWNIDSIEGEYERTLFNAFKGISNHIKQSMRLSQNELDKHILELGKFAEEKFGFRQKDQHDPAEFIAKLFEFINSQSEQEISQFFRVITNATSTRCPNPSGTKNVEYIYRIMLGNDEKSIQTLIGQSLEDIQPSTNNFVDMPDLLLIQLGRCMWNEKEKEPVKNLVPVEVTLNLVLLSYERGNERSADGTLLSIPEDDDDQNTEIHDTHYELTGLIVHQGNEVDRGHYYTYLHRSVDQEWICCDDSIVKRTDKAELDSEEVTTNCYLLLYSKISGL